MRQVACRRYEGDLRVRRAAFTLIELLVVVAIVGVLVALLIPAVQASRQAARRASCANNLKQIGAAIVMHHDVKNVLPPAWELDAADSTGGSSRFQESVLVRLLPYLEEANQYVRYNPDVNLYHADNEGVIESTIPVYLCPSMVYRTAGSRPAPGSYAACTGTERPDYYIDLATGRSLHNGSIIAVIGASDFLSFRHIIDGTSRTFAIGEFDYFSGAIDSGPQWAGGYVIGAFGATWGDFNPTQPPAEPSMYARAYTAFRSDHPGGAHFLLLDGSVHFVDDSISEVVLDALATRDRGEIVQVEDHD